MPMKSAAPITTEEEKPYVASAPSADASRRDASEGVPRAARRIPGRSGQSHARAVSAAQRDREGATRGQCRYSAPARGAHRVGGTDLAELAGEVGPVARPARSGPPTQGEAATGGA